METLWRIVRQADVNRNLYIIYILSTLLLVVFSIINFSALIPILELLFDDVKTLPVSNKGGSTIDDIKFEFYAFLLDTIQVSGKKIALFYICSAVMVSVFLANTFRYIADLCLVEFRLSIIYHIRKQLFEKVISQPLSAFSDHKKGDLISRMMNDIQEIENSVVYTIRVYLKEPFLIIGYLLILFSMSPELATYTLILFPISGMVISGIAKRLKQKARETQNVLGELTFMIDQMLSGIREVTSYGAQNFLNARFDDRNLKYATFNRSMGKRFQLAGPLSEVLGVASMMLILIVGGNMVLGSDNQLTASQFIAFLIIFSQILSPAKALSQAHSLAQRGIASANRINEIIDSEPELDLSSSTKPKPTFEKSIEFNKVSFSYDDKPVLNEIDFKIEKGNTYAIIGPSGSGKSTLADLICRFHDPTKGTILLDGENLKSFCLADIRELVAMVSQDVVLFNDTILNNITFGRNDVTKDAVIEAASISNAHHFIDVLPDGYDTIVGERGSKLSGGERQRIAIARAVLKNAPILILDEATSALDPNSEKLVKEALMRLMKGRTTVVITHKQGLIDISDQILKLEMSGRLTSG